MQLYALDKSSLILATQAIRDRSYLCPECHGFVRIRGGGRRQIHFYHPRRPTSCRQHGKSLAHLQIQLHLKSLIPTLALEKRFEISDPSHKFQPLGPASKLPGMSDRKQVNINPILTCLRSLIRGAFTRPKRLEFMGRVTRIADGHWDKEKIIFEVQCSPISLQEAKSRCEDYFKLGLTPVWILHDRRFNRFKLTPAEEYLRSQTTTFYTDGRIFYDQFDVSQNYRRVFRGPKIMVNLTLPQKKPLEPFFSRRWPLSFHGDLFHRATPAYLNHLMKIEKSYRKQRLWNRWKGAYKFLLYRILEAVSSQTTG